MCCFFTTLENYFNFHLNTQWGGVNFSEYKFLKSGNRPASLGNLEKRHVNLEVFS